MAEISTLRTIINSGSGEAVAIDGVGRASLTYRDLRAHVDRTVTALNRLGIGRNDRVAMVLPNGPEMAVAFVSIAAGATTAPSEPGIQARRVRLFPVRPECKGAPRRIRHHVPRYQISDPARHPRSRNLDWR